jgi:nucleotide-binding universal stress UspA family protein
MKRFKNILVVLDHESGSEALIERAVTVGQRNQARLTVIVVAEELPQDLPTQVAAQPTGIEAPGIDIIEELPPDIFAPAKPVPAYIQEPTSDTLEALLPEGTKPVPSKSPLVIQEQIAEDDSHYLDQVTASIQQAGVQVNTKVLHGTPFLTIIQEVLRNDHDMVMIAAEGRRVFKEMFYGRTSMHLMRKCPCPVWVMNPDQPKHYSHILAAVDPTPSSEERDTLNIKIMDLATSLAHRERCELLVIHTWSLTLESHMRSGRVSVPQRRVEEWGRGLRDAHRRWLGELLQLYDLENLEHQVYMLKGEAGILIPALAAAREVELIVMGTLSRSGVAGFFIGNTAEKVLHQVDCSVLTVKPEGFITPVKLEA